MHFYVAVISNLYSFNSFGKEIPSLFSVAEKSISLPLCAWIIQKNLLLSGLR